MKDYHYKVWLIAGGHMIKEWDLPWVCMHILGFYSIDFSEVWQKTSWKHEICHNTFKLSCTCRRHVSKMLAKCPNVADYRKIVSFRDILSETDTIFARRTCVRRRTKDRPNLMKVSKLPKNLSEIYFHSFVKNKNWYFLLFFLLISSILYY